MTSCDRVAAVAASPPCVCMEYWNGTERVCGSGSPLHHYSWSQAATASPLSALLRRAWCTRAFCVRGSNRFDAHSFLFFPDEMTRGIDDLCVCVVAVRRPPLCFDLMRTHPATPAARNDWRLANNGHGPCGNWKADRLL